MIPQIVPVIGSEDDHRVVQLICLFEVIEKPPQLIIALFDQAHVGGDNFFTHVVALKGSRDFVLHIRTVDRVWIIAFNVRTGRGRHIIESEHVVIRGRDDIGPMRFDIADMRAPWSLCLIYEFDRFRS